MISVHTPNFVIGLVSGIMAATLIPLGVTFLIVFGMLGLPFLIVGVIEAIVALVVFYGGRRRAAREEAARISHGTAQVVAAEHSWDTEVGARHPVKLTVALGGGEHTRALLVPSHVDWQPGQTIDVRYAPDDPANFVPAA
ncbi:hypothetical protein DVA67_021170 [Solirubrobacter sp. CPCC 204708]|uniref:DUF3592 domain-containing protein n=1 Tax=Solirubrobacter deserti TaxID=2282478 RepID=A0ABT4REK2_9ACTN|nr:hypothetical protein [Solirubrobacter deserti]MBE2318506.1 hypothetical protein [Solirubrobacter deserti]MDA0136964.1 hypothetical protein [Solirubrobacter deserti]